MKRLWDYRNKCLVMKQIHSNKALHYKKINAIMNVMTIIVTGFITFIGFSGQGNICKFVNDVFRADLEEGTIQTGYNFLVFILFIITIIHLVFGFNEKQSKEERVIHAYSQLINEIDDRLEAGDVSAVKALVDKYETITAEVSNTDKEYLKAKEKLADKINQKGAIAKECIAFANRVEQEKYLKNLLDNSDFVQKALKLIREEEKHNNELYIGGGVIRNLVWDDLHNYKMATSNKDIDVIYFNATDKDKSFDTNMERNLTEKMPNVRWSVKNQARMHSCNGDLQYVSLEDAVSKWPEIASAILVRKDAEGGYKFVAPFGYDDLLRLIVRPTPHFCSKIDKYQERVAKHDWQSKWKKLIIMYTDISAT